MAEFLAGHCSSSSVNKCYRGGFGLLCDAIVPLFAGESLHFLPLMVFRILSHSWSAGSDFSRSYERRIWAVEAMAVLQANAPEALFELVTEDQFQAWLDKQPG